MSTLMVIIFLCQSVLALDNRIACHCCGRNPLNKIFTCLKFSFSFYVNSEVYLLLYIVHVRWNKLKTNSREVLLLETVQCMTVLSEHWIPIQHRLTSVLILSRVYVWRIWNLIEESLLNIEFDCRKTDEIMSLVYESNNNTQSIMLETVEHA